MSVLDTSVVLKWFIDEEDSIKAVQLKKEYYAGKREIVVPDILLLEVINTLRYNPSFKLMISKNLLKRSLIWR